MAAVSAFYFFAKPKRFEFVKYVWRHALETIWKKTNSVNFASENMFVEVRAATALFHSAQNFCCQNIVAEQ